MSVGADRRKVHHIRLRNVEYIHADFVKIVDDLREVPATMIPYLYKTRHGDHVWDVFMSLIHTCELCGTNPFDYLTELERHAGPASSNPRDWMPWNYRWTLDGTATALAAVG